VDKPDSPTIKAFGWHLPDWLHDFGPPVLVLLQGAPAILAGADNFDESKVLLWLALATSAAALVRRRTSPLAVLGTMLVIVLVIDSERLVVLPTLIALFTVAEYREREKALAAAALTAFVLILAPVVHGQGEAVASVLSRLVAVGLAVALGLYIRARADYVGGLRDRAARLERERELLARQAAGEERVRIARELHDVVAHNVSLMVVQAQALAATSGADNDQRAALARLADLGREALSEMHRMLGVLRLEVAGPAEREPQPGVSDLESLVTRTAETGLDVRFVIDGTPRELPSAIDLSAYRIVQEALTNVIRHASAQHVDVVLKYAQTELRVSVCDDGVGPSTLNGAPGHGLVGMRERVALFGGSLEAGASEHGRGYRVSASFPTS
jgi:signal transduction histidine kinase